jgi:hypothetical protein
MWKRYKVELQIDGPFAAALPKTEEEIKSMIENRMPSNKPDDAKPIDDLIEQVSGEVGVDKFQPGWATFKCDENGLYYEGRCVRGHIKDCALQVAKILDILAFKAKVSNNVYVETDKITLLKQAPDGFEKRFIQVMTRQGPRSTYKYIDYINSPKLEFVLKLLERGPITVKHLETIFEYGGVHGIGQERSQGWGRYTLVGINEM